MPDAAVDAPADLDDHVDGSALAADGGPDVTEEAFDVDLAADDRSAMMEPIPRLRRRAAGFLPLVATSLAVHLGVGLFFLLVVKSPKPIAAQVETPVEIVQEIPPPPEPKKPEVKKEPSAAAEPPKPEAKTPELEKPPEKPKDVPKEEQAKQEPPPIAKSQELKSDQPKSEQPKPVENQATTQDVTKAVDPPKKDEPSKPDESAAALKALQDELATLTAQKDALQAEQQSRSEPSKALGPLPESFRAVALPADAIGGDDAVSYEQAVFSRLAKAKKAGKHVVAPGVAHVAFAVDANGNLIDVTLDHPSGDAFLDGEAVAIVRRAAPFPVPPQGAKRHFDASMSFVVED